MRRLLCLAALCACALAALAQPSRFSVLTYNTENAFDTIPSAAYDDAEYTPQGERRWTRWRYMRKLGRLAQVVLAADTVHPVDVAVLQEVESDSVVADLLRRTPLASVPYEYVLAEQGDARGIRVAILYSPLTFSLLEQRCLRVAEAADPTRDVVVATGRLASGDTLDVYGVHLPSRLGGTAASGLRRKVLALVQGDLDSVARHRQNHLAVVAGDMNADASDSGIGRLCGACGLTNLTKGLPGGSYKYRGRWSWIDQMLVSAPLLQQNASIRLLNLPFLQENDDTYGGRKPFRTYLGPIFHGGYSDHLPVVMSFSY